MINALNFVQVSQKPSSREHSLLGDVSLNGWSPVLQVWIQLLHYIQITAYFLFWSVPVLLNWRPAVQWVFFSFFSLLLFYISFFNFLVIFIYFIILFFFYFLLSLYIFIFAYFLILYLLFILILIITIILNFFFYLYSTSIILLFASFRAVCRITMSVITRTNACLPAAYRFTFFKFLLTQVCLKL